MFIFWILWQFRIFLDMETQEALNHMHFDYKVLTFNLNGLFSRQKTFIAGNACYLKVLISGLI